MSPRCKSRGGLKKTPTPAGVPVAMTSPGRSVIPRVMWGELAGNRVVEFGVDPFDGGIAGQQPGR